MNTSNDELNSIEFEEICVSARARRSKQTLSKFGKKLCKNRENNKDCFTEIVEKNVHG